MSKSTAKSLNFELPASVQVARQLDQERIQSLTTEVEALRDRNGALQAALTKSEADTREIVLYFQREIQQKDKMIGKLNSELRIKDENYAQNLENTRENHAQMLQSQALQYSDMELNKSNQIRILETELLQLEEFRREKSKYDERLGALSAQLGQSESSKNAELEALDRKYLLERGEFMKDMSEEQGRLRETARREAQKNLDDETKRIAEDNRRMREELRFQSEITSDLNSDMEELRRRNQAASTELDLLKEQERQFAFLGHAKNKQIRELKEQVKELKAQLTGMIQRQNRENQTTREMVTRELESQTMHAAGLRKLLQLKEQELNKVRSLAQTVLEQRTETEQFFLESLEEVKEKLQEQQQQRQPELQHPIDAKARKTFPKLAAGNLKYLNGTGSSYADYSQSRIHRSSGSRVMLRDLTWQDRELVLRLLFAKMNQRPSAAPKMEESKTFTTQSVV